MRWQAHSFRFYMGDSLCKLLNNVDNSENKVQYNLRLPISINFNFLSR